MANLPVPVPRTFSVSEIEVAAYLNTLRDALTFLLNLPGAVLTQAAAQSVANAAWTALAFDNTLKDNYGGHSNTTNNSRYTAQVAGWYRVQAGGGVVAAAGGTGRGVDVYKNGAAYTAGAGVVGNSGVVHSTTTGIPVFLNAGDYIEIYVWQNSGGALNTNGTGQYASWMAVCWESN